MRGIIAPALVHERDLTIFNPDMELALMFALMEYDKRRHDQFREASYEFFSKILWPLTLIQAGPANYIGIDRMKLFFDLQFKITDFISSKSGILSELNQEINKPQARIEHLTRWIDEIKAPFKKDLMIKGIIGPEILHGLVPLIKLATDKSITSGKLEPIISTDNLIEITNRYNQALKNIEETISKWHSLQQKVKQKIEKWRLSYSNTSSTKEQEQIESKFKELNEKIQKNIWACRSEIEYLFHWAIPGQTLNLVVPYTEIWISMYLAKIILPNKAKKFLLLPPSIFSEEIKSKRWVPVDTFHTSFYSILKEKIESTLEIQPQLTQKIETICNAQNLFLKDEANKLIARGIDQIQERQLIDGKYIKALQSEWQNITQRLKK
ncbi:MAG: hypothetical protein HWN66_05005 [Candidatus Helarchaeota archaeon]|nr:hypothetical protein [Candidatus Helarchaeota archaeon]